MFTEIEARGYFHHLVQCLDMATWQDLFNYCMTDVDDEYTQWTPYITVRPPRTPGTLDVSLGGFLHSTISSTLEEGDTHVCITGNKGTTVQLTRAEVFQLDQMHSSCLKADRPACHMTRPVLVSYGSETSIIYYTLSDSKPLDIPKPRPIYTDAATQTLVEPC